MLKRSIASVFVAALLCLVAFPVTALAAAPSGQVIYVGNENVTSGGYWTTDDSGNVTAYSGEGTPTDNYIHYDAADNTLTLHNATIRERVPSDTSTYVMGAGIGVFNQNDASKLTIKLEGSNAIENVSTGICVLAFSDSTGDASLTITGSGSLDTSGRNDPAIRVQSNGGNATLSIENAKVAATASSSGDGVLVQSKNDSSVSLTVDGGSLTATGSGNYGAGIRLLFGSGDSGSGTPSLTVSGNAIVRANSGISDNSSADIQIGADGSGNTGGIVWDGNDGTVCGSVTLQEDLEIGEGESLTIPNGSSLTIPNDKALTVSGGTLSGDVTGAVIYKVTGVSLEMGSLTLEVGDSETLTASITPDNATNKNVTWTSDDEAVATVDANGTVTAVAQGTAIITVTTADGGKTATCTVTVEHDPAGVWSSDADGHWHMCVACSDRLGYAAHAPKVEGAQSATCTEGGYTGDTVCSVCGYVIAKGTAIPATGHDFVDGVCTVCGAEEPTNVEEPTKNEGAIPATGDVAPLVCALAGIFGTGLVVTGLRKRVF